MRHAAAHRSVIGAPLLSSELARKSPRACTIWLMWTSLAARDSGREVVDVNGCGMQSGPECHNDKPIRPYVNHSTRQRCIPLSVALRSTRHASSHGDVADGVEPEIARRGDGRKDGLETQIRSRSVSRRLSAHLAPPARPQTAGTHENRAPQWHQGQVQPLVSLALLSGPLSGRSCLHPICAQLPSSTATAEPPGYEEGAKLPCYSLLSPTTLASTFRTRACRTRQLQLCVCDTVRGDSRGRVRP